MRAFHPSRTALAALVATGALVPAAVTASTASAASPAPAQTTASAATASPAHRGGDSDAATIRRIISSMTLDEKVGQLFVTYAYGTTATTTDPAAIKSNQEKYGVDNGAQLVSKYHLGGVIYFAWANTLTDPTTVATLSNGMQQAATTSGAKVPLLVSVDQEGGRVSRLLAPFADSPGNMPLGATFNPLDSYRTSAATAQQLRALGINVDDAPVVDTNTNPDNAADNTRSFGDNATWVSLHAGASVLGYERNHVAATAKHFPGLGSTSVNTDNGIAVSDQTKQEFYSRDIPSFRAAVAAGTGEVMAGHIVAPALDPTGTPASLSKPIMTGILRNQLHYNGVIVTDSLGAAALDHYDPAQRAVLAFNAGVDELLMPESLPKAIAAVKAAVVSGAITQAKLDQSLTRLLQLKAKLGVLRGDAQVDTTAAAQRVGTPAQNAAMDSAAARAVTLLRNTGQALPMVAAGKKVLITGWGDQGTTDMTTAVSSHGAQASRVYTGGAPSQTAIDDAVAAAKQSDATIVLSYNAWNDPGQVSLVKQLQASGKPVIVVATGAPYEFAQETDSATYLASYGYLPTSLRATADVIFGSARPTGHLPITIRKADGSLAAPFGYGLTYSHRRH